MASPLLIEWGRRCDSWFKTHWINVERTNQKKKSIVLLWWFCMSLLFTGLFIFISKIKIVMLIFKFMCYQGEGCRYRICSRRH